MVNIAVINLEDFESTTEDYTVQDIRRNNIINDSNLPYTIIISDFDETKFHRIFGSEVFREVKTLLDENEDLNLWYVGEFAAIEKLTTKKSVLEVVERYLSSKGEKEKELLRILTKLVPLIHEGIKREYALCFHF
jgi:hypothetical protein